jgi:hypothetical protein
MANWEATMAGPAQGSLPPLHAEYSYGLPGNVQGVDKFPDLCLHDENDNHPTPTSQTFQFAPRPLRTSSIISSSPSEFSAVSETSTRATSPTSDFPLLDSSSSIYTKDHTSSPDSSRPSSQTFEFDSRGAPIPRSRSHKQQLHAARVQRSASSSLNNAPALASRETREERPRKPRFGRTVSSPADALAALEPPHEQGLTRMAFAEQQRWITVQQKTFTKWYASINLRRWRGFHLGFHFPFLCECNTSP